MRSGADLPGPRISWRPVCPCPSSNPWRITLTPVALLDSAVIIVIAAGASKADAVAAAIDGPADTARYPAQLLRDAGERVEWIH